MSTWGFEPIGGPLFVAIVAIVLTALLLVAPSQRKLSVRQRVMLIALRTISALILMLVMLRPSLVSLETRKKPGTLILLADRSRSMQIADSIADAPRWNTLKETLLDAQDELTELAETWDLKLYEFDQETRLLDKGVAQLGEVADGPESAIGWALEDVLKAESKQRIVAVVLMSDGAQRAFAPRDLPPQTAARRLVEDYDHKIPLYTLTYGKPALGLQSDLRVDDLLTNDVVFAEAPTNVQVTVGADGYTNKKVKVQMLWGSPEGKLEVVDTRQIVVKENRRRIPVTLTHTPKVPGEYKLTVKVESPDGELATSNNQQSTFVTVLEGGVNVLYLVGSSRIGGGPGIEPRFVRAALTPHADINLRFELLDYRRQQIDIRQQLLENNYDVYLLGNVDIRALSKSSWRQIKEDVDRGAGLAMLGGYHSFGPGGFRGSELERVLPLSFGMAERQNFGEPVRKDVHIPGPIRFSPVTIQGQLHPILQVEDRQDTPIDWNSLPPLPGANRLERMKLKPNAQIVAETSDARRWPLMITGAWGAGRSLALAIDSTWRWNMEGFGDVQRRFWRQLVLWLARKDAADGQSVWVRLDGRRFQRGSRVEFSVGADDDNRELIEQSRENIIITKPDGSIFSVRARERDSELIGSFTETDLPGDYRVAVTDPKDDAVLAKAWFTVPDRDMELDQPAAEPTFMVSLASLTKEAGGSGLAPEDFPALLEELKKRKSEFEEEIPRKRSLWDNWTVLLLLVGILGTEWLLRKRWGLV